MRWAGMLAVLTWGAIAVWNTIKPLPAGTRVASLTARLDDSQLEVIDDVTASLSASLSAARSASRTPARAPAAPGGSTRGLEVLRRELALIDHADQLIVLDQTPLARDLGQHLLIRKREHPGIKIVVLADPLPEIYGGTPAHYLDALEQAGIVVVRIRLDRLRDPLPWYSALWRLGIGWWSDPYDETAPRAGLRAALRRSTVKADRRQLLVGDDGAGAWVAVVPAADGGVSAALAGGVARDMLASELKIAAWSTDDDRLPAAPAPAGRGLGSIDARFVSEGAIRGALVDALSTAADGDDIRLATPALSDRALLAAASAAAARGAHVRIVLDPDLAPNRAVAGELRRDGADHVDVRWSPAGASSSSWAVIRHRRELWVLLGSADFTRLSLDDFNLSAAVDLRLPARATAAEAFLAAFEAQWSASAAAPPAGEEAEASAYWRYRLLQAGGLAAY